MRNLPQIKDQASGFAKGEHINGGHQFLKIWGLSGKLTVEVSSDKKISLTEDDLGFYEAHGGHGSSGPYHVSSYCDTSKDLIVQQATQMVALAGTLFLGSWIGNMLHLKHIMSIPESLVFIVIGAIHGGINVLTTDSGLEFDAVELTLVLLPPIIFYSGFDMHHANFGSNMREIIVLAIVGTLAATAMVTGFILLFDLIFAGDVSWPDLSVWEALAFSALICAVDPVATLATFQALMVDPNLEVLIFGESLINDAIAIVLYKSFANFAKYGGPSSHFGFEDMGVLLLGVVFGSFAVGLGFGILHALVFKFTFFKHTPVLEILIFLFIGYSSFLFAEMFHFSGIIASLMHGVFAALFVKPNMSQEGHIRAHTMSNTLAAVADMYIFLTVGKVSISSWAEMSSSFIVVTLFATVISRAIATFPIVACLNCCRKKSRRIPCGHIVVMWWSGLRGAIAIGLVAGMPSHLRGVMLSTTVVVVLVTVAVNGSLTPSMLKWSNVKFGHEMPEVHGELCGCANAIHALLLRLLTNTDQNDDGVDDRYQTKGYAREASRRGSVVKVSRIPSSSQIDVSKLRQDVNEAKSRKSTAVVPSPTH